MKFPAADESLDGIINYVTKYYKSDLKSYIKTSNSSYQKDSSGWGDSNALLDLSKTTGTASCFCSKNEPFSNATIYFLRHAVKLESYTITSRPHGNIDMLRAWNIYGSIDNRRWRYIDSRGPTDDLIKSQTRKTYKVKSPGIYRTFRITQTIENSLGRHYFLLGKIEFFGSLLKTNTIMTMTGHPRTLIVHVIMILLVS